MSLGGKEATSRWGQAPPLSLEVGEGEGKGELGLGGGSVTTEGQETGLGATKLSEEEIVLVLVLIFVGDLEENAVGEVEEEFFVNVRIFGGARGLHGGDKPLRRWGSSEHTAPRTGVRPLR